MTALEVIEQIERLEPQERAKVLDYLRAVEAAEQAGVMDDQVFDGAAERVLRRHADLLRKLAQWACRGF